jgi:catechol 2,3-dioxygenase-like lactoylglutathione lyase family enzyme
MNNILFSRVGYVYLPVVDIDKSIEWYRDILGLELKSKFNDRGTNIAVFHFKELNKVALLLVETTDSLKAEYLRNGSPFPVVAINCPDIEYTYSTLKSKGVEVDELITLGKGEAKYFYFKDIEGNRLEAAWSIWD